MRTVSLLSSVMIVLVLVACGGTAPKAEITPKPQEAVLAEGGGGGPVVVYVVRHAEKAVSADAPKDPPLTEQGASRAAALAEAIDAAALAAVYSTPYARTRATAAPSAAAAGLEVIEYAPDDVAGLVAKIRGAAKGSALVVGHSNTVPEILGALGVAETVTLGDGDFGDLFVVTLAPDGTAAMERKRFGNEPPSAETGEPVP